MNSYILIITLAFVIDGSQAGYGGSGIASAEFTSKNRCEEAAKRWSEESKIDMINNYQRVLALTRSAICIKK